MTAQDCDALFCAVPQHHGAIRIGKCRDACIGHPGRAVDLHSEPRIQFGHRFGKACPDRVPLPADIDVYDMGFGPERDNVGGVEGSSPDPDSRQGGLCGFGGGCLGDRWQKGCRLCLRHGRDRRGVRLHRGGERSFAGKIDGALR